MLIVLLNIIYIFIPYGIFVPFYDMIKRFIFFKLFFSAGFLLLYVGFILSPSNFIGFLFLTILDNFIYIIFFVLIVYRLLKVKTFSYKNIVYMALPTIISFLIINLIMATIVNSEVLSYMLKTFFYTYSCILNSIHIHDFLENYTLSMQNLPCDSAPFPDEMELDNQEDNSQNNPNFDPDSNMLPYTQESEYSDESSSSSDRISEGFKHASMFERVRIPYDIDHLHLGGKLVYDMSYTNGYETLLPIKDMIEYRTDLIPLHLPSHKSLDTIISTHSFKNGYENLFFHKNTKLENTCYMLDKDLIYRNDNYVRISDTYAYPILKYMNDYIIHNDNRYYGGYTTDRQTFLKLFDGYTIGYDTRNEAWRDQLNKVKTSKAFEGETTTLLTSFFGVYFPLRDGFLIGPEIRNEGGVADAIIKNNGTPSIHVEYKSLDGDSFIKAFTQGKKYLYLRNFLSEYPIFSIYGKGSFLSFFIMDDHGHSENGFGLKGSPFDGSFSLYVDLEEMKIKILPQQNIFFPQYTLYDLSKDDEYLRAEVLMKFMSLYPSAPEVVFKGNVPEFIPSEEYKKTPVQLFYEKKTDKFILTEVDTKGKISYNTQKVTLDIALNFAIRPTDILTPDFVSARFNNK